MVLQTLRKGASGWIAKIFLVVLTLSFVIWGIADVFRGFGATTVATVGNTEISANEFRQRYLEQLQQLGQRTGHGITPEQARAFGLDRQILNQMIADATLDEQAARLGLAIGDAQIAKEIQANPAYRRPGADSFDAAYFTQVLRSNGLTEQRFVAAEKQRALRTQLVQSLGDGIAAPEVLISAIERFEGEMRNVSYILVTADAAGALPAPTEDQLKAFFEAHKITFRAPEYRKVSVLALTPADLVDTIKLADDELRAAYDAERARFGTPERREVQQIVFTKPEDAAAAEAEIKAGKSFADIAKARGLTAKDTDLGLVEKSALLDPKVADAAFSLADGAVSAPVAGRFGTVILHVTKIVPSSQQPFEEVKAQLASELALRKAKAQLLDAHDKIEDERASGATLAETAQKLGLKLKVFDAVDRSGHTPDGAALDVPGGRDLVSGAFATDPGVEADTVQLPDNGGFVWFETNAVIPSRDRTFDEAKKDVTARWTEDETAKAVETKAKALLAAAAGGKPLAQVAGEAELPLKIADGLRRGRADGNFSTEAVTKVFEAKVDGLGEALATKAPSRVVFQVTKIVVPKPTAEQSARINREISQQMENDILLQYLHALQEKIGVRINERLLSQAVGAAGN